MRESSPYLRQHAENPVDWYPWGPEALAQAGKLDRPIHLSVGYAACHWCHVMAHESFEDPKVAEFLNKHFVNIKVDRQERPDIDEIYQKVVQMMGQSGGWPLTVFLTPKGEPFFGGTYFPPVNGQGRPSFSQLALAMSNVWVHQRGQLRSNVERFMRGYRLLDERLVDEELPEDADVPAEAARLFADHTDPIQGGLGGAPKFPNPSCYDLVLRLYHRTHEPALMAALGVTLDRMAQGGIRDHLGGGFARYGVDAGWSVPHFEKMLYDQGQLVKLYADAYRATGNVRWRWVFEEAIDYVVRDLMHPAGGFYSSEDADSEGEEGRFYVWTPAQITGVLGEADGGFACRAYGVTELGNFEHRSSVLHRLLELDETDLARLRGLRERLLLARSRRVRPARDENVLTSWNALMIGGLCAAYQATGTEAYLLLARRAADFIRDHATSAEGNLFRVWKAGKATVPGFLDDYAFLTNALIELYESCFERRYLDWAITLVDNMLAKFWDDGLFFTPNDGETLVHRPRAPYDHAWPSGVSTGLWALLRLYELTGTALYAERAAAILRAYGSAAADNAFGFAHFLAAMEFTRCGPAQVVFAGHPQDMGPLVQAVHRRYQPARVLALGAHVPSGMGRSTVDGQPAVYVCRQQTCGLPLTNIEGLREYHMA